MSAARHPVQFQGSGLARWILARLGWQVLFEGLPSKQGVIVVYPHTSNWDFPIGLLAKWAIGIPVFFWGKDSLFTLPLLGRWMRWVGGLPVDRRSPQGVVESTAAQLLQARAEDRLMWLALAPEGTRSLTSGWRSGYYRLCVQTGLPLGLADLDWGRRQVRVMDFVQLSGDPALDYAMLARHYDGVRGYHPHQASPVQPIASPKRPPAGDPSHGPGL